MGLKTNKKRSFKIKNLFKSRVFFFVIGALIFGTIGVGASTLLYSKDITYDNSNSGLSSTNLQDALDELYEQAKTGGASVSCDDDGNCTVTCKKGELIITDTGYSCHTIVECPSDKPYYAATSTGYRCVPTFTSIGGKRVGVVTNGDGLYVDDAESGRYIYKGASPNNYITFSNETWRILAVESDGTLKIMKQDSIGSMKYDSNYPHAWSSSTLNKYLNGTYYNTLDSTYIQEHSFNVGTVSGNGDLTTTINEEKTTTWTGKIALANVSDVIKSNTNTSNCGSVSSINNNYSTCKTSSFIGTTMISSNPWLLSLYSGYTGYAWNVVSNGSLRTGNAYFDVGSLSGVIPVLYLSSSITLSGSGTSSAPYTIN